MNDLQEQVLEPHIAATLASLTDAECRLFMGRLLAWGEQHLGQPELFRILPALQPKWVDWMTLQQRPIPRRLPDL